MGALFVKPPDPHDPFAKRPSSAVADWQRKQWSIPIPDQDHGKKINQSSEHNTSRAPGPSNSKIADFQSAPISDGTQRKRLERPPLHSWKIKRQNMFVPGLLVAAIFIYSIPLIKAGKLQFIKDYFTKT